MKRYIKLRGFTLVEMLIGIVMMAIVIGGITFGINAGLKIYTRADAESETLSGMRWTLRGYNTEVSPLLANAVSIDIRSRDAAYLNTIKDLSIDNNEYYLYMDPSANALRFKTSSEDAILAGSEYLEELLFYIFKTDDYLLKMGITTRHPEFRDLKLHVDVNQGLYNKPKKDGDSASDITDKNMYTGNVIHFWVPSNDGIEASLDIVSDSTKRILNYVSVDKDIVLLASYDLSVSGHNFSTGTSGDKSVIEWYISASSSDSAPRYAISGSSGDITLDTEQKKNDYKFKVTSGDSAVTWGMFGVIRYKLIPTVEADGVTYTGKEQWSPWVELTMKENIDGSAEGLTSDIFKRGDELENNNVQGEQTFNTTTGILTNTRHDEQTQIKTKLASSTENGEKYLTLTPQGGKAAQKWTSDLAIDLITTIKNKDLYFNRFGKNVPDFTTPTNYSVVVDAEIADADAYGLFLSGAVKYQNNPGNVKNAKNSGYLFHYGWYGDPTYQNRLKMRLISGMADNTNKPGDHLSDISAEIGYDSNYSLDKHYHWTPSYLQNNSFTSSETKEFWHSRRRVIYTILEYYDNIEKATAPRYIVRARYLKRPDEILSSLSLEERYRVKKLDPWYTGRLFFDSEPAWWGGYMGMAPEKTDDDPPVVKYKIMNYTKYAEKYWETLKVFDTEEKTRYPLRCSESVTAILTARSMDIIADVDKFNLNNIDIFKSRTRGRFLGINVWVNDIGNIKDIGMKLFEFNLAPGFSKAELKAIMPKGAKMYELSDLVGSDWQSNYPWLNSGNQNMNSALFSGASSNGDGNGSIYTKRGSGIMGLQHIPSDSCECPLCLRQAGKEY